MIRIRACITTNTVIKGLHIRTLFFLLLFSGTSVLLFLSVVPAKKEISREVVSELFDPELQALNSKSRLTAYMDSLFYLHQKTELSFDTPAYVNLVSDVVKKRFFHGLSSYSLYDNWIAALSGKIFWDHLSAIVDPDDILKHPNALCSQQNIIFATILKEKGIVSRAVGLGTPEGPGHYLSEVWYEGHWHLYDVDREPYWQKAPTAYHKDLAFFLQNKDILYDIYENRISRTNLDLLLKDVKYGEPDIFPARKMLFFHQLTSMLTYVLPLFFLYMLLRSLAKVGKSRKKHAEKKSVLEKEALMM